MQNLVPFLWCDGNAEEMGNYYLGVFGDALTNVDTLRYGDAGPGPKGDVMMVSFEIKGVKISALNVGPGEEFTRAISFAVMCDSQDEVDRYWDGLAKGGEEIQCGWVRDKFGVTWQIVPRAMIEMLSGADPEKTQRAMQAMFQMVKLDLPTLQKAYNRE